MDRKITKKNWTVSRIAGLSSSSLVVLLVAIWLLNSGGKSRTISMDKIETATVKTGIYEDMVAVIGTVEPLHTFYLDAAEGGRVETILVEEGSLVKEGEPLLRLSNTALMLDFMNRETQIVEQINNLRNTRMALEQAARESGEELIELDYQLATIKRQFVIDSTLIKSEAIAKNQLLTTQSEYEYLQRKKELANQHNLRDSAFRGLQLQQVAASIQLMERNLEAIRKNLDNLTIKSPVSGQLTALNVELGESKSKGENIGRVDVLDGFLVKASFDEHYITQIKTGQSGRFDLSGTSYELNVTKVFPEVSNNQFEVEMTFAAAVPQNITAGQSLQVKVATSKASDALLLPKGAYFNHTGGQWVYVLEDDNTARIRAIKPGRTNPGHIEVLEGLVAGEQVIVSDYRTLGDADEIILSHAAMR